MNAIHTTVHHTAVFDHPEMEDHENIVIVQDANTGLKAIIAVHGHPAWPRSRWLPRLALRHAVRSFERCAPVVPRHDLQELTRRP